jgi:thiol-disulfide isomerase/thioredoxin
VAARRCNRGLRSSVESFVKRSDRLVVGFVCLALVLPDNGFADLKVGARAPAVSAARWYNTSAPLTLEGLGGKVVLLDFWGVWCTPCREQMPKLIELHRTYAARGLVILAIHTPKKADQVPTFLRDHGIPLIVAVDTGETANTYGVDTYPTYVLLDSAGRIVSMPEHVPAPEVIERLLKTAVS